MLIWWALHDFNSDLKQRKLQNALDNLSKTIQNFMKIWKDLKSFRNDMKIYEASKSFENLWITRILQIFSKLKVSKDLSK